MKLIKNSGERKASQLETLETSNQNTHNPLGVVFKNKRPGQLHIHAYTEEMDKSSKYPLCISHKFLS